MTSLLQTADAGCLDFVPHADATPYGLQVALTAGASSIALPHTPDNPLTSLHTALLFRLQPDLTGSLVVPLRGLDNQHQETFRVELHPTAQTASVIADPTHTNPTALQTPLPALPRWTTLNLALDAAAPTPSLSLRLNGRPVASSPLQSIPNPTTQVQIGAPRKHADTIGTLHLDQIHISPDPIGVPLPPVRFSHPADPTRWLVLYNTNHPDGPAWADHYRQARAVPHANLLGLPLPLTPTLDWPTYQSLRDAVTAYLDTNQLRPRILGILIGFAVPAIMREPGSAFPVPVANLLQTDDDHALPHLNPLFEADATTRPTADALTTAAETLGQTAGPIRLAATLDAPTLAEAIQLTDRASTLIAQPLDAEAGDALFLDPHPHPPGSNPGLLDSLLTYSQGPEAGRLRLPRQVVPLPANPDIEPPDRFTQLQHDALHLTLRTDVPPVGYFAAGAVAGRRALSLNLHTAPPAVIDNPRDPTASDWINTPITAGYAAALAPITSASPSHRPQPPILLEALRLGYTLAEAVFIASPALRSPYLLLGDPLSTLTTPQAGYDRFGPFDIPADVPTLTPNTPHSRLPLGQDPLDLTGLDPGIYILRRLDPQGRSDAALHFAPHLDYHAPQSPAWPNRPGWTAVRQGRSLTFAAVFATPLTPQADLVLEADPPLPDPPSYHPASLSPTTTRVHARVPLPGAPTRFRWSITHPQHSAAASPWSATLS